MRTSLLSIMAVLTLAACDSAQDNTTANSATAPTAEAFQAAVQSLAGDLYTEEAGNCLYDKLQQGNNINGLNGVVKFAENNKNPLGLSVEENASLAKVSVAAAECKLSGLLEAASAQLPTGGMPMEEVGAGTVPMLETIVDEAAETTPDTAEDATPALPTIDIPEELLDEMPEIETPEIETPELEMPSLEAPAVPSVEDVTNSATESVNSTVDGVKSTATDAIEGVKKSITDAAAETGSEAVKDATGSDLLGDLGGGQAEDAAKKATDGAHQQLLDNVNKAVGE